MGSRLLLAQNASCRWNLYRTRGVYVGMRSLKTRKPLKPLLPPVLSPLTPISRAFTYCHISRSYKDEIYFAWRSRSRSRTYYYQLHLSWTFFSFSLFCGFCNLIFGKACSDLYDTIQYDTIRYIQPASLVIDRKWIGRGQEMRAAAVGGTRRTLLKQVRPILLSRFSLSFNLCLWVVYRKLSRVERQPMPTFKPPTQWYRTSKAHRDTDIQSGIGCTFRGQAGSA
jgi:hypothetical protein